MKKIMAIYIHFFLTLALFGNDYHFHQLTGGTLVPANIDETYIELVDEVIINNNSKYWIYGIKKGIPSHNNSPLNNENLNHFWDDSGKLIFKLVNFEPEYNDTIEMFLWHPMFDLGPKPLPYYFYYWNETFKQNDL